MRACGPARFPARRSAGRTPARNGRNRGGSGWRVSKLAAWSPWPPPRALAQRCLITPNVSTLEVGGWSRALGGMKPYP